MQENIKTVLASSEKLENIEEKSDGLSQQALVSQSVQGDGKLIWWVTGIQKPRNQVEESNVVEKLQNEDCSGIHRHRHPHCHHCCYLYFCETQ